MKNTTKELLILGTAFAAMALIAPFAFADNINQNQSGAGNTQIIGDGNNSPGSNSPHLTATGGTAIATGGSAHSDSSAVSVSSQKQHQSQGQGQSQSADNNGNAQNVNQNYEAQKRNPVSTAFAAPLAAGAEDCMGSSSAGGQAVGFGLSVGSTWHDENCDRSHDAVVLHNLGQHKAAVALMCQDDKVASAMEAAGTPCLGSRLSPSAGSQQDRANAPRHQSSDGVVYEYPTSVRRW